MQLSEEYYFSFFGFLVSLFLVFGFGGVASIRFNVSSNFLSSGDLSMNTPKSRTPKRHKPSSKDIAEGRYEQALTNKDFLEAIGHIASTWQHVEEAMMGVFAELLNVDRNNVPIRQIYYSIINANIREGIMRTTLENSIHNFSKGPEWDAILDEYHRLRNFRNKYVHGLWSTHENGKVYISESSTDDYFLLSAAEVSIKELEGGINSMKTFVSMLFNFNIKNMSARYGFLTPSQEPSKPPSEGAE